MKVFLETYGCNFNVVTSEIMAAILKNKGYQLAKEEDAELVILNTCAIKGETERKTLKRISELKDSNKLVLVTGCLPELAKEKIEEINPEASIVGLASTTYIADVVEKMKEGKQVIRLNDAPRSLVNLERVRINPITGHVLIAEGSNDNSRFSVERIAHGSLISYQPDAIMKDVLHALQNGAKEITLTALDVAAYGSDSSISLPALLRKIHGIPGNFKVKLDQMQMKNILPILDDLILSFNSPKIYRHLDLVLHSGSNKILKEMNCGYTIEEFNLVVSAFRKKFPNMCLSMEIIVGWPGETDEEFQQTLDSLKMVKPDSIEVYPFVPRVGTQASKLQQIPSWKIKTRLTEVEHFAKQLMAEKNKQWENWAGDATVLEKTPLGCLARNFVYKPIYLPHGNLGDEVKVKVIETKEDHLVGQIVGYVKA